MRSGGTPNLSITPCTSSDSRLMVFTSATRSFTSCARSLSPVEMMTRQPASPATRASVPITSSASTPGTSSTGQPSSRTAAWMGSICETRSSGMGGRWALYWSYISLRKVGPLASKTQAACPARNWSRSTRSMPMIP